LSFATSILIGTLSFCNLFFLWIFETETGQGHGVAFVHKSRYYKKEE
jgi:hypothetical protein